MEITLGAAFDASCVKGWTPCYSKELEFHQIDKTNHHKTLKQDYNILRNEGFEFFRDSCWLTNTFKSPDNIDWSYIDKLATLSHKDIQLSISHYEFPTFLTADDLWNGKANDAMQQFAYELASRYKDIFHSYIPTVELGYWTAMISNWNRWFPCNYPNQSKSWWETFHMTGGMCMNIAMGLKDGDSTCKIAMAEPWNWDEHLPFEEQARPFNTLLGHKDEIADRENVKLYEQGSEELLDIIGLNFYALGGNTLLRDLLLKAKELFPNKEIMITETGNCHSTQTHSEQDWIEMVTTEVAEANKSGASIEKVVWSPVIQMFNFEYGEPTSGHLFDMQRKSLLSQF